MTTFFDHDGACCIVGTGNVWDNGDGVREREWSLFSPDTGWMDLDTVTVAGHKLEMSRRTRSAFLAAVANCLGGAV